nr:MAG TPA: hypothetical protein [Caudoviricetes sp.]
MEVCWSLLRLRHRVKHQFKATQLPVFIPLR